MTEEQQHSSNSTDRPFNAAQKNYGDITGQVLGHYLVEQRLGGGATASVYRATDRILDQTVALKVLLPNADDTARLRFRREARTVSKLIHPHIVRTLQVGQLAEDGLAYIAMDLVEGESLASLLEHVGQLSLQDAARLLAPMAQALAHAHKEGVIHRDVKPSNILLRRVERNAPHSVYLSTLNTSYVPLLSDFGIARALDAPELTNIGRTIGTPAYMSPEQCAGSREVDGRADIYSLGAVLYRALVGRPPFTGTTTQILHAHVYEPLTIPEDIVNQLSPSALDILRRSLIKEPNQRYGHVNLMANDLVAVAGAPDRAPTTTALKAVKPPVRRDGQSGPESFGPSLQPTLGQFDEQQANRERTTGQHRVDTSPTRQPTRKRRVRQPVLTNPPQRASKPPVRLGWLVGGAISAFLVLVLLAFATNLFSAGGGVPNGGQQIPNEEPGQAAIAAAPTATSAITSAVTSTASEALPAATSDGGTQSFDDSAAVQSPQATATSNGTPTSTTPPIASATPAPTPTLTPTPVPSVTPEQPLQESLAQAMESYTDRDWNNTLANALLARQRLDEFNALPAQERAFIGEMLFTARVGRAARLNARDDYPRAAAHLTEAIKIAPSDPLVADLLSATVSMAEAPASPFADDEMPSDIPTSESSDAASDGEDSDDDQADILAERDARRLALQEAYVIYAESLAEDEEFCLAAEQATTALALAPEAETTTETTTETTQAAERPLAQRARRYSDLCTRAEQFAALDELLSEMSGTLVYSTQEADRSAFNIYRLPAEENASSTLIVRNGTMPAASTNGRWLAYRSTVGTQPGIFSRDLSGAALAPDERGIRFSDKPEDGSAGRTTWANDNGLVLVYSTRGPNNSVRMERAIKLSVDTASFNFDVIGIGKDPAWHPLRDQIVFSGDYGDRGQGLFLRPPTQGQATQQITTNVTDQRPDWTPNGRYVIFMRQTNSNWDLYRVDVNNPSSLLRLTNNAAQDGLPAVSPDGRLIAFVSDRGGEWRIWVMSIDGAIADGGARPLANVEGVLYNWLDHHLDWYESS